eukprot:2075437-Rhodomonas_salina.2
MSLHSSSQPAIRAASNPLPATLRGLLGAEEVANEKGKGKEGLEPGQLIWGKLGKVWWPARVCTVQSGPNALASK